MFVAVVPPAEVVEDLAEFLAPRTGITWIDSAQWHLTLAFLAAVPDYRIDDLAAELAPKLARQQRFRIRLTGAGAFPNPARAAALWLGVDDPAPLTVLAGTARRVANSVGATPDGRAFVPHVTVARPRRPIEATKWYRILDTYRSPAWDVEAVELIESHLGEGPRRRPRYVTAASFPLPPPERSDRPIGYRSENLSDIRSRLPE
ncbi:RNA 2',3'-cyclic phosphodiesterase [Skermania piniformis]